MTKGEEERALIKTWINLLEEVRNDPKYAKYKEATKELQASIEMLLVDGAWPN